MSWITECPQCATRFRVTDGQLAAAGGMVRCGACLEVFQAEERLGSAADRDDGPAVTAPDEAQARRHRAVLAGSAPPELDPGAALGRAPAPPEFEAEPVVEVDPTGDPHEEAARTLLDPSHARELALSEEALLDVPPEPRAHRGWWLVCAVLALALLAQLAWRDRERLLVEPPARTVAARVCAWLGCELPALVDLDALASRRLVVGSHPELEGVLRVEAVIVNEAPYPQRFPDLLLRFSDIEGAPLAARRFAPAEYLHGELAGGERMPPGRPIVIALDLLDPGERAVNYQLAFRRAGADRGGSGAGS